MKGKQERGKHALRVSLEKEAISLHCILVLTLRKMPYFATQKCKGGKWKGEKTLSSWQLKEEILNMKIQQV